MTTIREASRPTLPARPAVSTPAAERRPFRDNPRLILVGIAVLIVALVAMVRLADRSTELNPDFLSEVVLYALSAADLTMLVALVFVLARNIVKLAVERRRGLPFSRFRAKLVLAMLGLTIVPSVLVLLVGSELIRSSTQKFLSPPIEEVLRSANRIAGDYIGEREARVAETAARIGRSIPTSVLASADAESGRRALPSEVTQGRVSLVEVYRVQTDAASHLEAVPLVSVESPTLPRGHVRASADLLASRVLTGGSDPQSLEPLVGGSELVRAGARGEGAGG